MGKNYTVGVDGADTTRKGTQTLKKVWNVISVVIVVAAVTLALLLVGTRIIGLRPLTVLSGSMEPEIKTGSLVYVKEVDTATLKEGDIITYTIDANGTYATHRIVEVIPEGMTLDVEGNVVPIDTSSENYVPNKVKITHRFRTKGDNNDHADATPVADVNVVGEVQFSIPLLGYVSNYIQNPPGTYVAISIGALLILLVFLPDLLFEDHSKKKKKGKEDGAADTAEKAESDTAAAHDETTESDIAEINVGAASSTEAGTDIESATADTNDTPDADVTVEDESENKK